MEEMAIVIRGSKERVMSFVLLFPRKIKEVPGNKRGDLSGDSPQRLWTGRDWESEERCAFALLASNRPVEIVQISEERVDLRVQIV